VTVYIKFYFAHNFLRHNFVRILSDFEKSGNFQEHVAWTSKNMVFKNAKNDIKVFRL